MKEGLSAELPDSDFLSRSREISAKTRTDLDKLLSTEIPKYTSEDTSLVVFGSLSRGEWTRGSDLDWTFLIDGGANSDHLLIAQDSADEDAHLVGRIRLPAISNHHCRP